MLRITLEREKFHDLVCYRHKVIEEMTHCCVPAQKVGMIRPKGNGAVDWADENNTGESIVADCWLAVHTSLWYRSRQNCGKLDFNSLSQTRDVLSRGQVIGYLS
jgi:hypothetical protein